RRAALLGKAATASVTGPGKLRFAARSEHLASFPEDVLAAFEKLPKPAALRRRYRDSVVPQRQRRGSLGSAVRLVVDEQPGRGGDVEGGENALDGLRLLVMAGIAGVDDVEQEVGVLQLFQRGAERRHQILREIADEPDRVGDDHLAVAG